VLPTVNRPPGNCAPLVTPLAVTYSELLHPNLECTVKTWKKLFSNSAANKIKSFYEHLCYCTTIDTSIMRPIVPKWKGLLLFCLVTELETLQNHTLFGLLMRNLKNTSKSFEHAPQDEMLLCVTWTKERPFLLGFSIRILACPHALQTSIMTEKNTRCP